MVAQVSKSPRQALLHRVLKGCDIVPFVEREVHDVVAAHVTLVASQLGDAVILTGDPEDMRRLARHVDGNVQVSAV